MQRTITTYLIDDDKDDQEFFDMAVSRLNDKITCEFADDAHEALTKLSSPDFIPDIIFIDINLPIMNGIDFLKEIKKLEHLEKIPKYIYSTTHDSKMATSSLRLGAAGIIQKLPTVSSLRDKLEEVFNTTFPN